MKKYILWIVTPDKYVHSKAFSDVALSLHAAFIELDYECEITMTPPETCENVVILGAHLLHPDDMLWLHDPIVWQLEQIPGVHDARKNLNITDVYFTALRRATVWDYSKVNIENLRSMGIHAKLLPVGYMPCLTCIENSAAPDIDVLHVGSLNPRREAVLNDLRSRGVKVVHAFNEYGVSRDALIARSKIVLNVHYYESKIFEIVRCSYLLSNRKCVVSEKGLDKELEEGFYEGIGFSEYDGLAARCCDLLADNNARVRLSQKGFEIMSRRDQAEYLRGVL